MWCNLNGTHKRQTNNRMNWREWKNWRRRRESLKSKHKNPSNGLDTCKLFRFEMIRMQCFLNITTTQVLYLNVIITIVIITKVLFVVGCQLDVPLCICLVGLLRWAKYFMALTLTSLWRTLSIPPLMWSMLQKTKRMREWENERMREWEREKEFQHAERREHV